MAKLCLEILTPKERVLELAGLSWLQIRLTDGGAIGIWPGHAPLVAATVAGPLRYATAAEAEQFDAPAGILKVQRNVVTIFVPPLPGSTASPQTTTSLSRLAQSALAAHQSGESLDG